MSYKVLDVCRHVINYSNEHDYGISNLKLQKVLYFIQAYFVTVRRGYDLFEPLFRSTNYVPILTLVVCGIANIIR